MVTKKQKTIELEVEGATPMQPPQNLPSLSQIVEEGQLAIDVYQNEDEIIVQSAIAGVSPENLDISINEDMVTIRGARTQAETISEQDYFYKECFWGAFSRAVILPSQIDADSATAVLKNGILTVRLPKIKKNKARKLKVVHEA
jgi:HSP20 family protein